MQIVGEKGIGKFLKVFLQICFWAGIIILIAIPIVLKLLGYNTMPACTVVIYPNGIVLLTITHYFIKLFNSLRVNNPFCRENVKILKRAGIASLIGSILWLIDFLFEVFLAKSEEIVTNGMVLFLSVLFLGVSIALYIIAELIRQATEYKQENELTI